MDEHKKSFILYDWCNKNSDYSFLENNPNIELNQISADNIDTQSAVIMLSKRYPNDSIAWLNLAAAHNVCGSYSVDFGGSQEEEVATNCDGAAILGTAGKIITEGVKSFARGNWVQYNNGY
jgi:hypothetical protein